jgi:predicted NAD/FAD-dependent oxidoreductase
MIPVAIVGAGIAGLACAGRLAQAGMAAVLFDKGRGIGGRVTTRRIEGLQFDHGAQYVTSRESGFADVLADLSAKGAVAVWDDGSGRRPIVGRPGMSALAKALGAGLEVHQAALVTAIIPAGQGWTLRIGATDHAAARVVVTVPAPQVAGLLGSDHPLVAALAPVRMEPCLTLMAATRAPAPFLSRRDPDEPLAWIAQDSSKPGRPDDAATWVAQAGPAFSKAHLERSPAEITTLMLPLLCDRLGIPANRVTCAAAHRWRYARVSTALGRPFLRSPDATLYLGGDWCLGPRVEAAWTSGTAIAEDLLGQR